MADKAQERIEEEADADTGVGKSRGRAGPVAGRAATVTPSAERSEQPPGGERDVEQEVGSPGAMEDEQASKGEL